MKNLSRIFFICLLSVMSASCETTPQPTLVPAVERPKADAHRQNIIGEVEPVYLPPATSPFLARIDTGAQYSAIDAKNIKFFERDGEKWVAFTIVNRQTGESRRFEKELIRHVTIKRIEESEKRPMVEMDVKFGNETFRALFSLADRSKFDYQMLIGRNILTGRAIVDTSLAQTLH